MPITELVLVRHGETAGQSSVRLHGITDVELDDLGCRQMLDVRTALASECFDHVVTSPLRRCRHAARLIAPATDALVLEAFREIDFGAWEGLTWDEAERLDPVGVAACRRGGSDFRFPGGDSRADFRARVAEATSAMVEQLGPRVLTVAHKGVIKTIMSELLFQQSSPPTSELSVDLGSIHRLRRVGGRWSIVVANSVDHLVGV